MKSCPALLKVPFGTLKNLLDFLKDFVVKLGGNSKQSIFWKTLTFQGGNNNDPL
jgi:hypothetical protein